MPEAPPILRIIRCVISPHLIIQAAVGTFHQRRPLQRWAGAFGRRPSAFTDDDVRTDCPHMPRKCVQPPRRRPITFDTPSSTHFTSTAVYGAAMGACERMTVAWPPPGRSGPVSRVPARNPPPAPDRPASHPSEETGRPKGRRRERTRKNRDTRTGRPKRPQRPQKPQRRHQGTTSEDDEETKDHRAKNTTQAHDHETRNQTADKPAIENLWTSCTPTAPRGRYPSPQ